jgi:iron complex outermembrane receptor protein
VEIESQLVATDWLTLGVSYAYMDAHFTSVEATNTQGNRIPYAPKDQVHLSADVHHQLPGEAGRLAFGIDYTYHTKVFFDNANSAPTFLQQRSIWHNIVNAHLEYDSPDSKWKASLWGKNIFGEEPALHAADITVLLQSVNEFLSPDGPNQRLFLVKYYPVRTFGVTVTRTF